jgi:SAM-dependent methyltransferase
MEKLEILCCPDCKGDLALCATTVTPSRIKSGVLVCPHCGDVVGAMRNFKYDFLHFDRLAARHTVAQHGTGPTPAVVLDAEVLEDVVSYDDLRIHRTDSWTPWDGRYLLNHGIPCEELSFSAEFFDAGVRLLKHPWSGIAGLMIDGRVVKEVDLYQPKWATVHWFSVANDLPPGCHTISVVPTGKRNPAALGQQVLVHEIVITRPDPSGAAADQFPQSVNRVLPISPEVIELMERVPKDGLILDCGGGDRVLNDPRYVNVEYLEYQLPAVYGDAMKLPFKPETFDLVFSQAVLEHVPNPFVAVEEMRRVAKRGGTVWAGMAFLQPVHAVPYHYFNATPWGIAELFRGLQVEEVTWFGELSFTVDWLFQTAGIPEKLGPAAYEELMARIKPLDGLVSYEELRGVASGVAVRAGRT